MSYPLTTQKIPNCMTSFWHVSCMTSLRGHRTLLVPSSYICNDISTITDAILNKYIATTRRILSFDFPCSVFMLQVVHCVNLTYLNLIAVIFAFSVADVNSTTLTKFN